MAFQNKYVQDCYQFRLLTVLKVRAMTSFKHTKKSIHKLVLLVMKNILNAEYIQMYILWKFISETRNIHMAMCHFCIRASSTKRQACSVHPVARYLPRLYTIYSVHTTMYATIYYPFSHVNSIAPWEHKSISLKYNGIQWY